MITTHLTMDDHSLKIERDGEWIGHIMWHADRPPRIVLNDRHCEISLSEIETAISAYKDAAKRRGHIS